MAWLERSKSQLSKTFFQIENQLNIKKVMSKNVLEGPEATLYKVHFQPFRPFQQE